MRSPRGHQAAERNMRPSPVAGLQLLDVVLDGLHCNGSSCFVMNGTRASVRTAEARRRVDEKISPPVVLHAVKANARPETPPRMRKKPVRRIVPATAPISQMPPRNMSTRRFTTGSSEHPGRFGFVPQSLAEAMIVM